MKKIMFISVFSLILIIGVVHSQFVNTGGPGGGKILSLCTMDNRVYAGTESGGVYVSDGTSWSQVINGMGAQRVNCLIGLNNTLYAGTNSSLYKIHNNGGSWANVNYGGISSVTALASSGNDLYAGTSLGKIYRSTNSGNSWTMFADLSATGRINSILIANGNIYIGTYGIYFSSNGGANWYYDNMGDNYVYTLHALDGVIRAGTSEGGKKTTSPLNGWAQDIPWTNPVYGYVNTGDYILAGMTMGWFWSSDRGESWNDPNNLYMQGISVWSTAQNGQYVFAGTDNGVYKLPISQLTGVSTFDSEVPERFSLLQNYPNPFNPETMIRFSIPRASNVTLKIYDQLGKEVALLLDQNLSAGNYGYRYNASGLSSGIYFYRISTGEFDQTRKMILVK